MSPEQIGAVAAAAVAIIGAITGLIVQVAKLRTQVNGRLSELLEQSTAAARREGELAGRDYVAPRRRRRQESTETPSSEA